MKKLKLVLVFLVLTVNCFAAHALKYPHIEPSDCVYDTATPQKTCFFPVDVAHEYYLYFSQDGTTYENAGTFSGSNLAYGVTLYGLYDLYIVDITGLTPGQLKQLVKENT